MSNPTPKFPIGSRVKHNFAGPGTVIGHPFPGETGDINLPVKFDHPIYDGTSGWFESFFTLIEPLDGEMKDGSVYSAAHGRWYQIMPRKAVDGDIYPPGYSLGRDARCDKPITFGEWARNRRTVNLLKRCENAQQATSAYYEAHKAELHKNIKLRHELDDAKAVINSLRETNKVYQEQITRKSAQITNLIDTFDTVRKAVQ